MAKRGIQQRGLDLIFGNAKALEESVEEEEISEQRKKIVLYLRDGLSPADRNFTKYPNEIHKVMRDRLTEEAEGVLYIYLWRQSWGYGRNYCRVSYLAVNKDTVIGSKKTAQRAMAGLVDKRFVVKALDEGGERDFTQEGGLYRVLTPDEISKGMTEEGIALDEIPEEGVVMMTIANMTTPSKTSVRGDQQGVANMTIANMTSSQNDYSQDDHSTMANMTIANMTTPAENQDQTREKVKYGQNDYSQYDYALKDNKDSLKDTLSPRDIISGFYKGIGQSKISKTKRES